MTFVGSVTVWMPTVGVTREVDVFDSQGNPVIPGYRVWKNEADGSWRARLARPIFDEVSDAILKIRGQGGTPTEIVLTTADSETMGRAPLDYLVSEDPNAQTINVPIRRDPQAKDSCVRGHVEDRAVTIVLK